MTKAQYVKRRSVSPPVGSDVKLCHRLAQRTSTGINTHTHLPSSSWLDLKKVTRPLRSKRAKSSRKMARATRAVYVTIICGVSNSDSFVLWQKNRWLSPKPTHETKITIRTNRWELFPAPEPVMYQLGLKALPQIPPRATLRMRKDMIEDCRTNV